MGQQTYKGWSATYDKSNKKWTGRKPGKPAVCACNYTKLQVKIDKEDKKPTKVGGVHYF